MILTDHTLALSASSLGSCLVFVSSAVATVALAAIGRDMRLGRRHFSARFVRENRLDDSLSAAAEFIAHKLNPVFATLRTTHKLMVLTARVHHKLCPLRFDTDRLCATAASRDGPTGDD
jgi:hypothetical protein